MTWSVLARFELVGESVKATYFDALYQDEVEGDGIQLADAGRLHPTAGRRFYEAIDFAYLNSSNRDVVSDDPAA